jgi:hypothetical protein
MTSLQSDLENNQLKSNHVCSLICPTFDYLINEKIITNVSCLVPNCDETFPSQSCLNFHLSKVHRINNQTVNIFQFFFGFTLLNRKKLNFQ